MAEELVNGFGTIQLEAMERFVTEANGIVGENSKEAAEVYGINHNTLRGYLNGQIKKQTCLEYKKP